MAKVGGFCGSGRLSVGWDEVPKKTMEGGRILPTASLGVEIIRD